ncbi:carbohydrate esterase family 5 protein [Aplosporella prunicola CBS 121167]|uniref:Carbohydrate esterase family 5 protein n=1 Tax=Aplosporella prunicola CBS 121167 TaxID=1176127 RepID=A0A6A6B7X5_9PEZI|nr:carbohydrate esterase family 5 protein [Aplosporella prunicola CBS 121167]KAF2140016.1 carbohydrate esterase family 5 protein [Aplosporella prunicola CBS 121167]
MPLLLPLLDLFAAAPLSVHARPTDLHTRQTSWSGDCLPVHVMIGRGTTQEYPGSLLSLADLIIQNNKDGADYEDIVYPATFDYTESTAQGYEATISQLTTYASKCPESKVVLLGYSQGAHVTGDALAGGGGGDMGAETDPVSTEIGDHVAAVVWYGDPRHMTGEPYDQGTATAEGLFPRTTAQLANLKTYADRIRSYCDLGDPVCAGGDSLEVHSSYPQSYDEKAAAWVQTKLQ